MALLKKPTLFPFFKPKKPSVPKIEESRLPHVRSKTLPGVHSQKLTESLKRFECPQITYVGGAYPIFIKKARASNFFDVDGNRFLDLTSGFGVTGLGHSPRAVLEAMKKQAADMMHGLGDIHPNEMKVRLAQRLSEITPGNLSQSIFSSTGAEAVETAMKTAVMHTGKTGLIAFEGAYHGLGYGALHATHREDFRRPFAKQMGKHVRFAPFPDTRKDGGKASEVSLNAVKKLIKKARRSPHKIGAVLVEPIQGRGGVRVPPADFLKGLRQICDAESILLIADEVFTGFGRTGSLFAVEKSDVVPDLLCLGKGMANGFPISVCIGSPRVMYSWGVSKGEALHTSTFIGNPLGSAAALAVIREIEEKKLVERSRQMGEIFRRELYKLKERIPLISDIRGAGLMIGIELSERPPVWGTGASKRKKPSAPEPASAKAKLFVEEALKGGLVVLTAGEHSNVISITPPLIFSEKEIRYSVDLFDSIFKKIG